MIGRKRVFSRSGVDASIVLLNKQEPSEGNGSLTVTGMKKASNPKNDQRSVSGFFEKVKVTDNFKKDDKENESGK